LCLNKKKLKLWGWENECKKKRIYDRCTSKENNIDAVWEVVGKSRHGDVHYHS